MSGKQAKILLQHNVSVLLKYACTRRNPEIACVIVLLSLKAGMRAGEIAKLLSLSDSTISTYRARILEKMGMKTNAELTHYAIQSKLVD